ncbi:HvfC/BufC N-terminal domain-containing protein [Pseudodonghicola flavimaris]|uniref:DNA-binding domain-containing protein n=1 Tax=Pseudodonghicola flavimaris TaxID=3050036 RepID=A0ABT7F0E7_9RHOB|nr:DNA-binding domain-containing protein [Pseudodonghicola flavimaris]MDK3018070.1 DNA-binding domain-containing protein [Pseudodonghicola flavimaris]
MGVTETEFTQALLAPDLPVPEGLCDAAGHPAGRRFAVYRNNVAVSLTRALHEGFPVIARLLGPDNMDGLAGLFLRAHPPRSPVLMLYGATFPAFLEGLEQLAHLGYLGDVARLELALRQSYHAADAEPVDAAALAALPPDRLAASRLTLAPAVRLVRSPWPIHDIWRFNTEADAPQPRATAQDVLVVRPEYDPRPVLLPAGGAVFLAALRDGVPLAEADAAARRAAEAFALAPLLAELLSGGAITGIAPASSEGEG